MIEADALVQRYRAMFALFDWTPFELPAQLGGPGRPAHPQECLPQKPSWSKCPNRKPRCPSCGPSSSNIHENDITYFVPLCLQTVAILGCFPTYLTADAAFDAWYVYQSCVHRGIAAIPLNQHGHPECHRASDGVPLCPTGLRMHPTYQFSHTYGYQAQRFRCPLLFPSAIGQRCSHEQFHKGQGCVKDLNWEAGAQMRVTLDRDGPLYQAVYYQRTSAERINSHAKEQFGLDRPLVSNGRSVRYLNTLTYILINLKALQRPHSINASLLSPIPLRN